MNQNEKNGDVYVINPLRTPIGRLGGALSTVRPDDLLATVFKAIMDRTGLPGDAIDEVVAGCANQAGEDNRNIARMAWLLAGGDQSVAAFTVNRLCASGLTALSTAYRAIKSGEQSMVLVGGVESMSRAPYSVPKPLSAKHPVGNLTAYDTALGWRYPNPRMAALFPLEAMGETAENIVERYHIGREAQDQFALESHEKAVAAMRAGHFDKEILPIEIPGRKGSHFVTQDEGPREDTSLSALSKLRPAFREGGSVTAGNSSSLNDGAAGMILASHESVKRYGLSPMARILGTSEAGVDPRVMGLGPIESTRKLMTRLQVDLAEVDLVELNEAFAAQALAVIQELGLDRKKVNVQGGAIALGHPLGMSGARIVVTLLHSMKRLQKKRGLATLCVGVGQGASALFELP